MLSTVIPVYNEVDSLDELHKELSDVAAENGYELDIVFVDDGSNDGSWEKIESLAAKDRRVRGVRFRRNFGKAAALSAGFDLARGDIVMTLDADLQDDPAEIPRFLEAMEQDKDVISGWKKVRHDPWHKVYPSWVFNSLVSYMTGVKLHDHNCGFKCYRREIFDEVRLYGELHRFVPVLAAARGWRVGELVVNHRRRQHGVSKYGVKRFIKGFLDLSTVYFLTGFEQRPQHMLGTCGIFAFGAGMLGVMYLTVLWMLRNVFGVDTLLPLHQRPALDLSIAALLLGANFMSMGFIAELMTAYYGRSSRPFSIRDQIGGEPVPADDKPPETRPPASGASPTPDAPASAEQAADTQAESGAAPDEADAEEGEETHAADAMLS